MRTARATLHTSSRRRLLGALLGALPFLAASTLASIAFLGFPRVARAAPVLHSEHDPLFDDAALNPNAPAFPNQSDRPQFTGEKKLTTEHFVVHYTMRGEHAPDVTDADGNGHPDYVDLVASAYEESWAVQQVDQGWAAPPSDAPRGGNALADVYIQNFASRGAAGVLGQAVPEGICGDNKDTEARERDACPGYTLVGHDIAPSLLVRQVCAHEWQHQVQFGYVADPDWSAGEFNKVIWLYESSSKWMDQYQFAEASVPASRLRCFMENRDLNINAGDSPTCGTLYRYAPFIVIQYLAERFDTSIVRQIWERAARERIFDDAVWRTIEDRGDTFPAVWRDFSTAIWTLKPCGADGDISCFERGDEYRAAAQVVNEATLIVGTTTKRYNSRQHGNGRLDGQAADYFAITTDSDLEVRLEMGADPVAFSFLGVYRSGAGVTRRQVGEVDGRELVLRLRRPAQGEQLVLVLANGSQRNLADYTLVLNPIADLPEPTSQPTATGPLPTPTTPPAEPTAVASAEPATYSVLLPRVLSRQPRR